VFVPVKLDEGFDFSLFLEDLSFDLPMNLMLTRMRQQHPVVVRALRAALEPQPPLWEGWRTAGTLVVFRPLQPTPWIEAELAGRQLAARLDQLERDREQADALADSRLAEAVAAAQERAADAVAEATRRADAARAALEVRLAEVERRSGGDAVAQQADLTAQLE